MCPQLKLQPFKPIHKPQRLFMFPEIPLNGKVFQVVQKHWKKFEYDMASTDQPISPICKTRVRSVFRMWNFIQRFIRLVCDTCKKIVSFHFSCKKRGFCPSCTGRRMNEGAAFLVDHVFPQVPVRQWVVSFPMPLRFWMARNPRLAMAALHIFQRILKSHYVNCAKKQNAAR
jgi:hypothetical protein